MRGVSSHKGGPSIQILKVMHAIHDCINNVNNIHQHQFPKLRWPEPIYMHVGYVFELCLLAGTIELISMIFDTFNE